MARTARTRTLERLERQRKQLQRAARAAIVKFRRDMLMIVRAFFTPLAPLQNQPRRVAEVYALFYAGAPAA